jgi:Ca2+-transporting ATPase
MRDPRTPFLANDILRNPYIWAALAGCTALLLVVVHVPFLAETLHLAPPGARTWLLIIVLSLLPVVVVQVGKWLLARQS